jgi:acyl-CoA thioester hydrolase
MRNRTKNFQLSAFNQTKPMNILNDFVIKTRFPVDWGDMDPMQHINNVVFLRYFENSRILYYEAIGLSHSNNRNGVTGVVKSIFCEYLLPLVFPDTVEVGARVIEMAENCFTMEHYIWSEKTGLCAFGETEITVISVKTFIPVNIPEKIRLEIERIEQRKF